MCPLHREGTQSFTHSAMHLSIHPIRQALGESLSCSKNSVKSQELSKWEGNNCYLHGAPKHMCKLQIQYITISIDYVSEEYDIFIKP